jgi:hypothetical protein
MDEIIEYDTLPAPGSSNDVAEYAAPSTGGAVMGLTPGLAKRMIQATKSVKSLTLDGTNKFHGYRYPTIAQVRGHANRALAEAGIAIIPSITRSGRTHRESDKGKIIALTVVELDVAILSEDGCVHARWIGESEDSGDKGLQKAVSNGVKAFLAHLLLMPVGDEDSDSEPEPAPVAPPTSKSYMHWYDRPGVQDRFWAWAGGELGLCSSDVCRALGVENIHDFESDMSDAKSCIEAWVGEREEERNERATTPNS